MKPTSIVALVLILVGAVAAWRPQASVETQEPTAPDAATRALVEPLRARLAGQSDDARVLSQFYAALADAIERDAGQVVKTMADVREANRRAGRVMFQQTGIQGKYPGLGEAIDEAIATLVGLENVTLDAAKRTQVVATFRALSWVWSDV